ncbi:MAG TPA: alpha/beta hydrolase [Caulobacteraceae bacterium]|jgi:pimeloyl-ACP methyl ester carboxylesterase
MAYFRRDDLRLAYDDTRPGGDEAGVALLVHGFATNRQENWRRLGWLTAFERKGWRTVAIDLRGHGESDKPHDPALYDRDRMAGDIIAVMDHLELRRVDLMGYSMGAHLALAATLTHPDRVGNLILGGIGRRRQEAHAKTDMTMAEAMRAEQADAIVDPTLRGFRLFAEAQGEDRLALAACSEAAGRTLAMEDLGRMATPTLLVAGAADEIAGDPQPVADAITGAKCVVLPGCDHFSAIPHALFKAAVFDFLEGWLDEGLP